MSLSVGIDFGTSGARLIGIDDAEDIQFESAIAFASKSEATSPQVWLQTLFELIGSIPSPLRASVRRIAIDGTSSTILLCDCDGKPLLPPKMYCDRGHPGVLHSLQGIAPPEHMVLSRSSSLCKYLSWQREPIFQQAQFLLHQADWLAAQLHGQWGLSDYHNSLKLGFDPVTLAYPDWFSQVLDCTHLPKPLRPGKAIGPIIPSVARQLGLSQYVEIMAGTTDSIAAFLASGAREIGDAVTSLGSTIALKLLSQTRVEALSYGVYSHWFGDNWLVGGASNAGGAVLSQFFSLSELEQFSNAINWTAPAIHSYMPLLQPGERFPVNDPRLKPCLEPRPDSPVEFLQGILASLTRIETEGYQVLTQLGASTLRCIYTAGGGTRNAGWMKWRKTQFDVPVLLSNQTEAAFGAAKLALRPIR